MKHINHIVHNNGTTTKQPINIETYQHVISKILGSNKLERNNNGESITKDNNHNVISHSIAYTQITSDNKYTDGIHECLRIGYLGTMKGNYMPISGLIHIPAIILSKSGTAHQKIFTEIIGSYHNILSNIGNTYNIYYGGGKVTNPNNKIIYDKAEEELLSSIEKIHNKKPLKITGPKNNGYEIVHINTQDQTINSLVIG